MTVVTISRICEDVLKPYEWQASQSWLCCQTKAPLTIQPHPEPWIAAVVALNCFFMFSTLPNAASMASLRGPGPMWPPDPFPSFADGARFFQKREWLMWPNTEEIRELSG